ncbi:unnamed protein product [Durusdinium trenchii]|uniref:Uncharacterized protein n=1 Tax=Durusdinium trenchii TaxID=1381693 RepID=A0ABP0NH42_9DINO
MGWVDQVMRLEPGDRVNAFFKVNDGRLRLWKNGLPFDFETRLEELEHSDRLWHRPGVCHRTKPWSIQLEVGSVADVHFEVGDDGRRSTSTDIGIILSEPMDGRVQVQFQDTIQQTVPLGWIVRLREWAVGDRVQAHFKTGGGEKSTDTDVATVMSSSLLEVELYFDDGIQQHVSKAWVTERIRDWHAEVSELAPGDVVIAHFKRPGNHCRSVQTDRGIVVSILPRGEVSVTFQDDITQVVPKGWIQAVATRWTGQRDEFAKDKAEIVAFESKRLSRAEPQSAARTETKRERGGAAEHPPFWAEQGGSTNRVQDDLFKVHVEVIPDAVEVFWEQARDLLSAITWARLSPTGGLTTDLSHSLCEVYTAVGGLKLTGRSPDLPIFLRQRANAAAASGAGSHRPGLQVAWRLIFQERVDHTMGLVSVPSFADISQPEPQRQSFTFALAVEKSANCAWAGVFGEGFVNVGLVEWVAARKDSAEASTAHAVKSEAEDEHRHPSMPCFFLGICVIGFLKGVQWFGNAAKFPLFQELRFRCDYHLNRHGEIAQVKVWFLPSPLNFEYGGEQTITERRAQVGTAMPGQEDEIALGVTPQMGDRSRWSFSLVIRWLIGDHLADPVRHGLGDERKLLQRNSAVL